jgi:predicted ATP-dependent endonuclease of OLD family
MKIRELHIENFRSIKQGNVNLTDFSVLIGKNNAGKSNIIDCLSAFCRFYEHSTSPTGDWKKSHTTAKQQDISIDISVRFALTDTEYNQLLELISENESGGVTSNRTYGASEIRDEGWLSELKYQITFEKRGNVTRKLNLDGEYVEVDNLHRKAKIHGARIRDPIEDFQNQFDSWVFVDPFREPAETQTTHFRETLDPDGENLIQVLDSLHQNFGSTFEKIVDAYVDIMEGVSDLRVEYDTESGHSASSMTIIVEEEKFDVKFNSKDISSGSKEILVLLTQIYLADRFANVLIIEEPELHVHPGAERKLFEILQDVVDRGTQVIVATHSDVFVNESEASNIVRVERDGHTQMRTLSEENTGKELAELGYNKSGLLQSEAVVFVEGRSDKRILKKFAKNSGVNLNSEGIAVVELEGIKNMLADAKSLVKLLYSFDIPYLFLRDKHDKPREAAQGELYDAMKRDDGSHWWEVPRDNIHVWNSYGIESYLLDAEAIAEGLEMEPSAVQEIVDSHQETDDKGEVLDKIYAEEHDNLDEIKDVYAKDRHGMEIASRIPPERLDSEVQDVIIKITELLDAWDRDQLNFQTSSDSN